MSDDREQSPDWIRSFQVPVASVFALSSDSDASPVSSPIKEGIQEGPATGSVVAKDPFLIDSEEEDEGKNDKKRKSLKRGKDAKDEEPLQKKVKDERKEDENGDAPEEGIAGDDSKKSIHATASSMLPLVFPEKVQRHKALVECDGDSIDLSGDVGAVGRVVIANMPSGNDEMLFDLKGTIYKTTIVPSNTFCVVSFGQTEAKIEAIMTDFIQLKPHSNVFEAETMIEGTLDGFSFDSEDDADRSRKISLQQDVQGTENGEPAKAKTKRNKEKSGAVQKKTKNAGKPGKPTKRAVRKPQATRKGKSSKK